MSRPLDIRVVALAALLLTAAVVVVVGGSRDDGHEVSAVVNEASYITPGTKVTIAGRKVGAVSKADVTPDGRARMVMTIDDERAWPLPEATGIRLRWLSTIALGGRYVELRPPSGGGTPLPDGGEIQAGSGEAEPVEFDMLFRTFNKPTRRNLSSTLRVAGTAIDHAHAPLRRALDDAPAAVAQARAVMEHLGARPKALDTLVRSTDRVLTSVRRSEPGLGRLIAGASETFTAIAARASDLKRALGATPPMLAAARRTLARADGTLRSAQDLTNRLSGGSRELRRLAPPLERVLATLLDVGPDARSALARLRVAAPDVTPLLRRARTLMPRIESVAREGASQLACVRPYAPEVAGLAATWAGFQVQGDKTDKYARVYTPAMPFDVMPLTTAPQAAKLFPSMRYAFPRPPGEVAGQPWFIPECGVGPESVDPSKDPEAR